LDVEKLLDIQDVLTLKLDVMRGGTSGYPEGERFRKVVRFEKLMLKTG